MFVQLFRALNSVGTGTQVYPWVKVGDGSGSSFQVPFGKKLYVTALSLEVAPSVSGAGDDLFLAYGPSVASAGSTAVIATSASGKLLLASSLPFAVIAGPSGSGNVYPLICTNGIPTTSTIYAYLAGYVE